MPHKTISVKTALQLCTKAFVENGVSTENALFIAKSLIDAELQGKSTVGWAHFKDYVEAVRAGRVDGQAKLVITHPVPALFQIDAQSGFPHAGVDQVLAEFIATTKQYGIAALGVRNAYICGELGYFVRRLADHGLLGLAATNGGPALLAASGSKTPVFCTNPLAFAVPRNNSPPLVIDQSSSATAFVNLRHAAENNTSIPEGWALDSKGQSTTDAQAALKGVLLAFGGDRGANIALMVEILAAGTTGANWSVDAPAFHQGNTCTNTGLFIIGLHADLMLGDNFSERVDNYLKSIQAEHQTYIPGEIRGIAAQNRLNTGIAIPVEIWSLLKIYDT